MTPLGRSLYAVLPVVALMASDMPADPWRASLALDGGGCWRGRIRVVVENAGSRAALGEPVGVPVGKGAGQADLEGQAAEALRVCDAQGTEMLLALEGPDGQPVARGSIPAGSTLVLPTECEAGKSAVYYVYFDNPAAGEVPDTLTVRLGVINGDVEAGQGETPDGWTHDIPDPRHRASWVAERPQSGERCLKTVVAAGSEPSWIATRQGGLHLVGGAKYRMRAWVRAENVKGFAGWYIHVGNRENPMLLSPMLSGGEGTYDWKEVSAEFTAPADADLADLGTVLRGTGTAWFDNVHLVCLEPGRLHAVAEKPERLTLAELGDSPWRRGTIAADRRAAIRLIHVGPESLARSLVCVDVGMLDRRLAPAAKGGSLAVFDGQKPVMHRRVGDLLVFEADVPPRTARTWHVYQSVWPGPRAEEESGVRASLATHNLVENPGFESGAAKPDAWTHDPAGAGVRFGLDDPGRPELGKRCAKMVVSPGAPEGWRGWRQTVAVQPGTTYLVAAWIKCQDIEGGEVHLHLHRRTADGRLSKHEPMTGVGAGIRGTTDWTFMSGLVVMPDDATRLELHLTMNTRGTVWHDGVLVAQVTPAKLARIEGRALAESEGVAVWQVPAVVKVFEDDRPLRGPSSGNVRLAAARNEQESLQLAVCSGRAIRGVRVEVDPPAGPQGKTLGVEVNVVGYVPIDYPTNYYRSFAPAWRRKTPTAAPACDGWPGRWPDPLLPRDTFHLAANTTQPVWITMSVPKDAPAGDYAGRVRLVAEGKTLAQWPYTVHVWDFALPDESHVGAIYDVHGTGGERFWGKPAGEAARDIMRFMARRRLCPDRVQPPPTMRYENGRVVADFAEFDKAAAWYFDELKLPFSYTPWTFYLFGWGMPPRKHFGEEPYPGAWPYQGADRSRLRPEFKKAYQACLKAFWDHLKEKGWAEKFILYISDEPFDAQPEIREQMKALCRMIHEVDPKIPIYGSTWKHVPEWDGFLDVWGIGHYGVVSPERMAALRAGGARIWFTTDGQMCIDTPYCAVERLLPHYCFKYGAQAYEFWGVSWYTYDPFRYGWHAYIHQSEQPGKSYWVRYPNGDGYLLYPGGLVGYAGPVSSIRLEQAREGVEDYEYLYLLRDRMARARAAGKDIAAAERAMAQAAALVTIPNPGGRYSRRILPDPLALDAARHAVAEAIERLPTR